MKGMKWGVRKGSSSSASGATHAPSADHVTAEAHKARIASGGVKTLSNHELQQLVTRLNLEQQHRNLMGQKPSNFDKGHSHIKKIISVGKTLNEIHGLVNSPIAKTIKTAAKIAT